MKRHGPPQRVIAVDSTEGIQDFDGLATRIDASGNCSWRID